jgi:membrane protein
VLTDAIAISLALLGDTLVFLWVLKGVPDNPFAVRRLLPGAVFGAVGFELVKLVGNVYLTLISGSVTAQALGGFVGLIIWINVVARFAFYTASWTATIPAIERLRVPPAEPEPQPEVPAATGGARTGPSPVRLALGLLGAGMVTGAVAGRLLARSAGRGGPPAGARSRSR